MQIKNGDTVYYTTSFLKTGIVTDASDKDWINVVCETGQEKWRRMNTLITIDSAINQVREIMQYWEYELKNLENKKEVREMETEASAE